MTITHIPAPVNYLIPCLALLVVLVSALVFWWRHMPTTLAWWMHKQYQQQEQRLGARRKSQLPTMRRKSLGYTAVKPVLAVVSATKSAPAALSRSSPTAAAAAPAAAAVTATATRQQPAARSVCAYPSHIVRAVQQRARKAAELASMSQKSNSSPSSSLMAVLALEQAIAILDTLLDVFPEAHIDQFVQGKNVSAPKTQELRQMLALRQHRVLMRRSQSQQPPEPEVQPRVDIQPEVQPRMKIDTEPTTEEVEPTRKSQERERQEEDEGLPTPDNHQTTTTNKDVSDEEEEEPMIIEIQPQPVPSSPVPDYLRHVQLALDR